MPQKTTSLNVIKEIKFTVLKKYVLKEIVYDTSYFVGDHFIGRTCISKGISFEDYKYILIKRRFKNK